MAVECTDLDQCTICPMLLPDRTVYEKEEIQQIPPGELTVRRGTRVEATDGYVGKVDEFVVHPDTGHITHLVMREGHLWGKKDVIIPLSALKPMGDTYEDTVFLNLDKHQIESLPTFPLTQALVIIIRVVWAPCLGRIIKVKPGRAILSSDLPIDEGMPPGIDES